MYPPSELRSVLSRAAFVLMILLTASVVQARALSIVLFPGDPAMQTAVNAVRQLRQDTTLRNVSFRIVSSSSPSKDDLDALARADVGLIYNMGRELANTIEPAVASLRERKARAYAVGAPYEEGEQRIGLTRDEALREYAQAGGADNYAAMIRVMLARDFGFPLKTTPPRPFPAIGIWAPGSGEVFDRFESFRETYLRRHPDRGDRQWVGLVYNRVTAQAGSSPLLDAMIKAIETRGFNVIPLFGYPSEVPAERFLLDDKGRTRVVAIVGLALKMGNVPAKTIPVMQRLDVPVINAISLYNQSREAWEASPLGLSLMERSWQISGAEFAGAIAPTVVASKEKLKDKETGIEYFTEMPIPDRIERLADRVKKWVSLRYELNALKRVAVVYYNYPPGKENVGAAYLNVLPRSLWQILSRLEHEGYDTRGRPKSEDALFETLREHGTNIGGWAPGALEKLARSGQAVLMPVAEYRHWFDRQPAALRDAMIKAWGEPEKSTVMLWRDPRGTPHFVFPAQRFGNLLFAAQPSRGWEGDPKKMYHDVALPPHHQYLAFYLWLQKHFKAHAMVHVGTHATHEWLSGKEVGFTAADPGEAMVADVPQLYPYIMDDIGEALQAKRRGMATIISHLTPPFDRATLNPELVSLRGLIDDFGVAAQKSESAAAARLGEINALAVKLGVLKDIGLTRLEDAEHVEHLEHYLKEISEQHAPFGLHTFGVAPSEALRQATATAILSLDHQLGEDERRRRQAELAALIETSARAELDALVTGLAGRHVAAGPGNDPLRNPEALPTGRNLYGFDPSRLPTPGTWEQGRSLAEKFIADYRRRHGLFPDRVVFNLWSTEAMRHEGVTEAEILALMGVRPRWDERGRLDGVEVIPRNELGRPRVDVTIVPSGLYRDTLPGLMLLLDEAVSRVKDLPEDDNPIHANVERTRKQLEAQGLPAADAARLAAVRIFTEPSGAYGTGVDNVVQASNTWKDEKAIADVYFNRVGHLFGQGYWGERPGGQALAVDLFKMALKDAKAAIHSRASNVFGTLDNDDVFQYLGATAMAIRQVNGATPETYILNLADGQGGKHETLDTFMGREMRTRYTNPEWVKAMLNEGYGGARFIMKVTEHLWGWQVTVPEAVDGAKWQEMYETYVADRNALGVKDRFRDAKNLLAYQAIVDKMLVAINKGYWQADPAVKTHLDRVNQQVIAEAGVACSASSCSSEAITALAQAQDQRALAEALSMPAPTASGRRAYGAAVVRSMHAPSSGTHRAASSPARPPAAAAAATTAEGGAKASAPQAVVEGYAMKEKPASTLSAPQPVTYAALLGFVALVAAGVALRARQRSNP